jgi:hypothetical protein
MFFKTLQRIFRTSWAVSTAHWIVRRNYFLIKQNHHNEWKRKNFIHLQLNELKLSLFCLLNNQYHK